ncbi:N-acetylglutamate synthase, CG3035 family [Mycobacterium ostraviense]|uniref:GCN5 family acetyltransferase n=1 Tax=Mycobacterium ostraviense TaxID=2738409 RepID=A0A162DEX6_9MYCO|nr:GCN5 family acetyltransferase [Mycobacterium ostraviense]KZS66654.1 GCN5 family acetyltransferase [Mycobacterium ostraviense]UGT90938.1 GNAT family N-acetyltransferase [Mycobacterium ostraviense]
MAVSWPDAGTRVTVRYRRPTGSVPPLTDAVGQLLTVAPTVRVRTKTGATVEIAPADVVAVRVLTDAPVRTAEIRAVEHAAAKAWPGGERCWLDGWLLRAGDGATPADSAVPLDISARAGTVPAIADWYRARGLTPRLVIPERLLPHPTGWVPERTERLLVRDVEEGASRPTDRSIIVSASPDDTWLRLDDRRIPVDVLTAVVDGELAFGSYPGVAAARAAVTDAPDGSRWVGLWATGDQSRAAPLYEALLAWGARRGATRAHLSVPDTGPAQLLGFRPHHRRRYLRPPDSL